MAFRAKNALPGETEIVQRRTVFTKAFSRPDGKVRVVATVGPQHYPDGGKMVEIDDTPETVDGVIWTVRNAPYRIEFNAQTKTLKYESKRGGGYEFSLAGFGAPVEPPWQEGQSIFVKPHPELKIELRCRASGVEIFKHILGPSAPTMLEWGVIEKNARHTVYDPSRIVARDNMGGRAARQDEMVRNRLAEVVVTKGPETVVGQEKRFTVREQLTGRTRRTDAATAARSWRNEVEYPIIIDVTVTEDIAANADDGVSNTTNFQYQNYCYTNSGGLRFGWWRWQSVDVPQAQTLDSATFSVNVTANTSTGSTTVKGDDVDSASAWTAGGAGSPISMTQTTASASFAPSGTGIKTLDVTSIIQEIIDRAGWAANNNIRIGCTTATSTGQITFEDFNAAGTDEGQLEIVYTLGGGTTLMGQIWM